MTELASPEFGFRKIHPSETAGNGERIGTTNLYKCQQCGFPVNARRVRRTNMENLVDGIEITNASAAMTNQTVVARSGCPHCGSFNWSTAEIWTKSSDPRRRRNVKGRRIIKRF